MFDIFKNKEQEKEEKIRNHKTERRGEKIKEIKNELENDATNIKYRIREDKYIDILQFDGESHFLSQIFKETPLSKTGMN